MALFAASLREQARLLVANLETDIRGNHLIRNVHTLAGVGAAFEDEREVDLDPARRQARAERLRRAALS